VEPDDVMPGFIVVQVNTTVGELLSSLETVDNSAMTFRVFHYDANNNEVNYTNPTEFLLPNSMLEVISEDDSHNAFYFVEPGVVGN
jgi:hypothetical protein